MVRTSFGQVRPTDCGTLVADASLSIKLFRSEKDLIYTMIEV